MEHYLVLKIDGDGRREIVEEATSGSDATSLVRSLTEAACFLQDAPSGLVSYEATELGSSTIEELAAAL